MTLLQQRIKHSLPVTKGCLLPPREASISASAARGRRRGVALTAPAWGWRRRRRGSWCRGLRRLLCAGGNGNLVSLAVHAFQISAIVFALGVVARILRFAGPDHAACNQTGPRADAGTLVTAQSSTGNCANRSADSGIADSDIVGGVRINPAIGELSALTIVVTELFRAFACARQGGKTRPGRCGSTTSQCSCGNQSGDKLFLHGVSCSAAVSARLVASPRGSSLRRGSTHCARRRNTNTGCYRAAEHPAPVAAARYRSGAAAAR